MAYLARYEETLESFDRSLGLDETDAGIWLIKGAILAELARYEEALESYDRSLGLDENNADTWCNKGVALHKLGRYGEALESYDRSLGLDENNAATLNNKGLALYHLARYGEALESYDRSLGLDENNAATWDNKGLALYDLARYEEALESYERSLGLDENNADAWMGRGRTLYKLGEQDAHGQRQEEAYRAFNRSIKLMNHEDIKRNPALIGQIPRTYFSLPFAFLRLCREFPALFGVKDNLEYWRQIHWEHASIIQLYEAVADSAGIIPAGVQAGEEENPTESEESRQHAYGLRILGLLNFDFGDMARAEHYFDSLDDLKTPSLMDEYYLLQTAHNLWQNTSAILTYAQELAQAYKGEEKLECYYKARLLLAGNQPQDEFQGMSLLAKLTDYLPAQYLLLSYTKDEDKEIELLNRIYRLEDEAAFTGTGFVTNKNKQFRDIAFQGTPLEGENATINLLPVREICDEVIRLTQLNELTMELVNFSGEAVCATRSPILRTTQAFRPEARKPRKEFCPPRRGLSFQ